DDLEAHVPEGPELLRTGRGAAHEPPHLPRHLVLQGEVPALAETVPFRHPIEPDGDVRRARTPRHITSAKVRSARLNSAYPSPAAASEMASPGVRCDRSGAVPNKMTRR